MSFRELKDFILVIWWWHSGYSFHKSMFGSQFLQNWLFICHKTWRKHRNTGTELSSDWYLWNFWDFFVATIMLHLINPCCGQNVPQTLAWLVNYTTTMHTPLTKKALFGCDIGNSSLSSRKLLCLLRISK